MLGYTALDPVISSAVVRRLFYRLAMMLSISYRSLIALTVLIGPFAATGGAGMIDLIAHVERLAGPFQGLVEGAR